MAYDAFPCENQVFADGNPMKSLAGWLKGQRGGSLRFKTEQDSLSTIASDD